MLGYGSLGRSALGETGNSSLTTLTGVSATGGVGELSAIVGAFSLLVGVAATSAVGTLSPDLSADVALVGVAATGEVGFGATLDTAFGTLAYLDGVEASGAVGALIDNPAVPLTGVEATGAVGTITELVFIPAYLVGVEARGGVGVLVANSVETNPNRLLANVTRRLRILGWKKPNG